MSNRAAVAEAVEHLSSNQKVNSPKSQPMISVLLKASVFLHMFTAHREYTYILSVKRIFLAHIGRAVVVSGEPQKREGE